VPFNPLSDALVVAAAALVFQPAVSIVATFAAQSVAITLNHFVARRYGATMLRVTRSARTQELIERIGRRMSYRLIFGLRFLLPITGIGVDLVSYLAGLRQLNFTRFYLASIVPWTILSVAYFSSTALLRAYSMLLALLPAALLVALPGTAWWLWRRRSRHRRSQ
jgi:uncharacterized membrane protein YdjX (TVP38/TMEM64 family)